MTLRVAFLSLCVLLGACPRRAPTPPPKAFDAAAFVPAEAVAVGRVDAPTLLGRPGLKEEGAVVQQVVEKVRTELGVDPSMLREATLFYAPVAGETLPQRGGAILPGAVRGSPGFDELGASVEHGGRTIHALGRGAARVSFVDGGAVLGDELSVRTALDVAAGKRPALPAADALWALVDGLGGQPFRLAVRLGNLRRLLATFPVPEELKALEAVGLGFDVAPGELRFVLAARSADAAGLAVKVRALVQNLLGMLRKSMLLRVAAGLLEGAKIEPVGDRVILSLAVPMALARTFLPLVLSSIRLR
jgi:hypothetical protein